MHPSRLAFPVRLGIAFTALVVGPTALSGCTTTVRDFGEGGAAATTGAPAGPGVTTPNATSGGPSGSTGSKASGSASSNGNGSSQGGMSTGEGSASSGVVLSPNGTPCADGSACASSFCVDGVCCNETCGEVCQGCTASGTGQPDGTCAFVVAGTDPGNECDDAGQSSCGTTGMCSGGPSCALYGAGTECAPVSCSTNVITFRDTCDGNGGCVDGGGTTCGNYRCVGDTCLVNCAGGGNGDCVGGTICLTDQTCGTPQPNGVGCNGPIDCQSGNCVDGVCCDSPCNGLCESCVGVGGTTGTCTPIESGDPDNECGGNQICCVGICRLPQQCFL